MPRMWLLIGLLLISGNTSRLAAQAPKFVELVADKKPYQGKVVARNPEQVWLLERAGVLHTLSVPDISAFRKLSDSFTPISAADQRDQLRRELGNGFEIVGTGHYLVAGPAAEVRNYAETFEDQYRAVYTHFSVRGLDVHAPEFPLVAIVFPDAASFAKYAQQDKLIARPGLKGYYIQSTNRVALFHENPAKRTSLQPGTKLPGMSDQNPLTRMIPALGQSLTANQILARHASEGSSSDPHLGNPRSRVGLVWDRAFLGGNADNLFRNGAWADTDGDMQSTMIHEATHQVAFNIGIHSRIGNINPRWVVEGLATAFETPGMRSSTLANTPGAKLNQMRLTGFREFVKQRRQPKSLAKFVQSDVVFGENLLDGYAQAWALSFFLIETRPREYGRYLKSIAARPPLEPYDEEQRLADFKSAFGGDLTLLDSHFLRYIAEAK